MSASGPMRGVVAMVAVLAARRRSDGSPSRPAERQADDRHRADLRVRPRGRAGIRGRRGDRADIELLLWAGSVDAVADGRLGGCGRDRRGAGGRDPEAGRPLHPCAGVTVVGFAFTVLQDVGDWVNYSDHSLAQLGIYVGKGLGSTPSTPRGACSSRSPSAPRWRARSLASPRGST